MKGLRGVMLLLVLALAACGSGSGPTDAGPGPADVTADLPGADAVADVVGDDTPPPDYGPCEGPDFTADPCKVEHGVEWSEGPVSEDRLFYEEGKLSRLEHWILQPEAEFAWKDLYAYGDAGEVVHIDRFDADGELERTEDWTWNDEGRPLEHTITLADETVISRTSWEYGDGWIKVTSYRRTSPRRDDPGRTWVTTFYFDEDGHNVSEELDEDGDGVVDSVGTCEWDEDGESVTVTVTYDPPYGGHTYQAVYTFEGKRALALEHFSTTGALLYAVYYTYDDCGRLVLEEQGGAALAPSSETSVYDCSDEAWAQ
jgi:hypothetical protein